MREPAQLLISRGGERAEAFPVAGAVRGLILDLLGEVGQGVGAEGEAGALEPVSVTALVEELTGGDPALAAELLRDFFESSRADLEALEQAIDARNHDQARRHAHRLKGASLTLGAHALSDLAQQIEDQAANGAGDWERLRSLAAAADEQLSRLAHPTTADVPGA